jgi:hypothetical protein
MISTSSTFLATLTLALLAGSCANPAATNAAPAAAAQPPQLRIELRADSDCVDSGAPLTCSADLVNDGAQPVTIVLPGDGSFDGWRTPILRWHPPFHSLGRDCGNINPLEPSEVVTLAAGQRLPLPWIDQPRCMTVGTHALTLQFENSPALVWDGLPLGTHDTVTMTKVRHTAPFKIVSNEVRIEVRQ